MSLPVSSHDDSRSRMVSFVASGLLIMLLGLVWLAGNLGFTEARELLHQYWPVVLILAGLALLLNRRHDQVLMAIILMVAGGWAFAVRQQWVHVGFWAVFAPLMVMLMGGSVLWRAFHRPAGPENPSTAYIRTFAIMSGSELRPTMAFEGAELTAVMGGTKLDLSGVAMAGDTAVIDIFALMGGAELHVPADWDVTLKVACLMGGCVDKRRPAAQPATRHLVIQGLVVMGGVEIKD